MDWNPGRHRLRVLSEQTTVLERAGWTAAVFLLVSSGLERNTQRESQDTLRVPVFCHLIVLLSAFYRCFVFSLLSAVTLCTCQCDCHTSLVRARGLT